MAHRSSLIFSTFSVEGSVRGEGFLLDDRVGVEAAVGMMSPFVFMDNMLKEN
jgi:hypothetical protein